MSNDGSFYSVNSEKKSAQRSSGNQTHSKKSSFTSQYSRDSFKTCNDEGEVNNEDEQFGLHNDDINKDLLSQE